MAREGSFFGGALADLYSRGMDISRENPWALAQSSFPAAAKAQPGITMDQLLGMARDYLHGIQRPPAATMRPDFGVDMPSPTLGPESDPAGNAPVGALSNPGAIGQVTGVSGQTMGLGLGTLGSAMGLPGAIAAVPGMMTGPTGLGMVAPGVGLSGQLAGMLPEDLTMTTEEGPVPAAMMGLPTSSLGLLGALVSMAMGNQGPVAVTASPAPEDVGPEALTVANTPAANAGWTDTTGLTSNDPGQAGIGDSGSTPGGGPGGSGTSGGSGPGGAPGPGESGTGTGESLRRGGITKGKTNKPSKTKVHGQEFVVNAKATDKFRPQLEAMNALIPADNGRGLDQLVEKAKKFFDV